MFFEVLCSLVMEYMDNGCTNADSWALAQVAISASLKASQKNLPFNKFPSDSNIHSSLRATLLELLFPPNLLSTDRNHLGVLVKSMDARPIPPRFQFHGPGVGCMGEEF